MSILAPPDSDVEVGRVPIRARGGAIRAYAIVDAADAAWANQWKWHDVNGYAARRVGIWDPAYRQQQVYLHRELLGLPRVSDGRQGDHMDRDILNCRRGNLRILPPGKNQQNLPSFRGSTSQYRGVSWDKDRRKWVANLQVSGKRFWLGAFADEVDAAVAVRVARLREMPYAID